MTTGTQMIARVSADLLDTGNVRWTSAQLLSYLNDGLGEIVRVKPDANAVTENITMVAGTKQSLPAGGIVLIRVVRNMGADGSTPGKAITPAEMAHLDQSDPDWHTATAGAVRHFIYLKDNPKTFWVYPQPTVGIKLEAVFSKHPTDLSAATETIPLDEIYEVPLYYYMMARAYAKNSKEADMVKANGMMSLFMVSLGQKAQAQKAVSAGDADGKPRSNQ